MKMRVLLGSLSFACIAVGLLIHGNRCEQKGTKVRSGMFSFDLKHALAQENVYPVVVIGEGPGGLSASLYSARANFRTLVISAPNPESQLAGSTLVENWPGTASATGKELLHNMKEHAKSFGVEFSEEGVENVDFSQWPFKMTTGEGRIVHALSVIIATGANPRLIGIPGEKEYWTKGVSTCVTCDGPFYVSTQEVDSEGKTYTKDYHIAVVGGGDSAVEEAMQLSKYGKTVTIIARKSKMRAAKRMQQHLAGYKNVKVLYNHEVHEILGDGKVVNGLKVFNNLTNETYTMPIDGVFLAIGHTPNTQLFKGQLDMNDLGYLELEGRSQRTSVPGVCAAGDVEDYVYRQAGVAAGAGIRAALDTEAFLSQEVGYVSDKNLVMNIGKKASDSETVDVSELNEVLAEN